MTVRENGAIPLGLDHHLLLIDGSLDLVRPLKRKISILKVKRRVLMQIRAMNGSTYVVWSLGRRLFIIALRGGRPIIKVYYRDRLRIIVRLVRAEVFDNLQRLRYRVAVVEWYLAQVQAVVSGRRRLLALPCSESPIYTAEAVIVVTVEHEQP